MDTLPKALWVHEDAIGLLREMEEPVCDYDSECEYELDAAFGGKVTRKQLLALAEPLSDGELSAWESERSNGECECQCGEGECVSW